ncbi:MAG: pyridoxal phosphate-dependent aminotransferase [Myxococcales bacterium]
MKLSRRANSIHPSATLALNARANALKAQGKDVVGFAAGEPDFDTPEHVKQAAIDALKAGFTKYTPTGGIPELKQAICSKLKNENGLEYVPEQILVSVGAKHSLYNVFQALLDEGDEVIVFSPYWVSYPDMVKLAGGTPVIVPTRAEEGYAPRPDEVKRALTPKTRAVVINSPSNPTGGVLSREALENLADVLRGHDCLIVTDDIYEKLIYGGFKFLNIANVAPDLKARTVVVNGLSKSASMTGWRIGYTAAEKELIAGMQKIQDQSTSNPTSIAQKAAVAALTGPQEPMLKMVEEFDRRRQFLVKGLNAIPGVKCLEPYGAFYAFPDFSAVCERSYKGQKIGTSEKLAELLLTDFLVAAVPGGPFGAPGFLRFSFATSMQVIEKGLQRVGEFVKQLD